MAIMNNVTPQGYMYNQMNNYQPELQRYNAPNQYMRGFPQIQSGLPGKYIQSLNDVVVSEVPQDGSVAFFPTSDFSKIYAKAWTADGKIQTEEYVLAKHDAKNQKPNFEADILTKLERIEDMLMSNPSKKSAKKKEADVDD